MTTQIAEPLAVARDEIARGTHHFCVTYVEKCPLQTSFLVHVGSPVKYDRADGTDELTPFGEHLVRHLMASPRLHLSFTELAGNEAVLVMLRNDDVETDTPQLKGLPVALAEIIQAVINTFR